MVALAATSKSNAMPMALRAGIMVVGGLLGLFWPSGALATLVTIGGVLMILDGGLGLWRLAFALERSSQFWATVARGAVAVIAGLMIVGYQLSSSALGESGLVTTIAVLALLVAALDLYLAIASRDTAPKGSFWPSLMGAALYAAFGLLLLFFPIAGAMTLIKIAGGLMLAYGVFLIYSVWNVTHTA
ncbi:Uncharacterized membrane protein HdeD, DUF308 family [Devosia limi DSM 17137]|uniref:Uncharacterized membrane protein HdeD, DUF308 family n=2 Tax=Devosia limi DSM 17137 TaxID=1121477 RepID=A0A1M4Y479_9HYPH|nr:Uncharacterized membrane protein HdeD, DUF308 family [Devosia limi DSM 17137]